ncbi:MAG: hypothetical protein IJ197_03080 [Bacteroidaceae bacterium]|nr:hypothetical protein [Bacteroidaceae bacterium]
MKKLLGLAIVMGVVACILSCEDEAENPGDFNLKAELTLDPMTMTSTSGLTYTLEEEEVYDTVFTSTYEKIDTTFEVDANGDFVIGPDGKKIPVIGEDGHIVTTRTPVTFETGKRGVFHKMKLIKLESKADTFTIHIKSNARWRAPQYAPTKAQWFYNYNLRTDGNSLTGNGDGYFYFRTLRNKNKTRVEPVPQYIFTSDSTVMYQLNFGQAGERD